MPYGIAYVSQTADELTVRLAVRTQDGALTPEMEKAAMATADKLLGLSGSGITKSMQIVVTSFDKVSHCDFTS